ncbi:related to thermophilic desulfurizing enzyme [Phialocephala subalpina]|uniref:Related to thermophilic desulfurizing enzyme n=1 Tax=Phialocephala subalpina TaxID=576137 RepID=A0A1L7X5X9_9HELO|nr:related to thermophilic desulfurizing enzyme [Phialocephala subalpina]
MSGTIGHLSPGQWKNPKDRSTTKLKLSYWTNLAQLLERGNINALFLADSTAGHAVYEGSMDECIRRGAQFPIIDPSIPISAMAAVTKNLTFAITTSTSFETPFIVAKRFSTLDHLTDGRIGWNIVTSWKDAAFRAIGISARIDHDKRYEMADDYLRALYKLWEGSWSDDAVKFDIANDVYADPAKIREIHHDGPFYKLDTRHIVPPSPQRVPFLFQAGTSSAGSKPGATHAEAIFVASHSPELLRPKIAKIRAQAAVLGRDPQSLKFFASITPFIGSTMAVAQKKLADARKYASVIGGLVLFSSWTGIDISNLPLDEEIRPEEHSDGNKISTVLDGMIATSENVPKWTPRVIAEKAAFGGLGPCPCGTPNMVADEMQRWIEEGDLDGFNIAYVTTPRSFEDVVYLLVPELRRRGLYPEAPGEGDEPLTAREKVYGKGQKLLRSDHVGSTYRYDVYQET